MIEVNPKVKRSLSDIIRSTLTICGKILNLYSIRNLSWNLISHLTSGHSNPRLTRGKRRCCLYTKELLPKTNKWVDKEKGKKNEDDNSINNVLWSGAKKLIHQYAYSRKFFFEIHSHT